MYMYLSAKLNATLNFTANDRREPNEWRQDHGSRLRVHHVSLMQDAKAEITIAFHRGHEIEIGQSTSG